MKAKFVGGRLNGLTTTTEEIKAKYGNGEFTPDLSFKRSLGIIVRRAELDNQPKVDGYVGPMWNGDHLRYESNEMYERMSR